MSRITKTRWIVIITTIDGQMSSYGPWHNGSTAEKFAEKLRAKSFRFTNNPRHRDFDVDISTLERWPGIRALTA